MSREVLAENENGICGIDDGIDDVLGQNEDRHSDLEGDVDIEDNAELQMEVGTDVQETWK